MKIVLHGINYSPEKYRKYNSNTRMAHLMEINKIITAYYYPNWQVKENKYFKEKINLVDVQRCPIWVTKKLSGLKRLIHLASFALSSLPILFSLKKFKPDLILTIAPSLFCAPTSILYKLINKKTKNWIHIQDFELDAAFELGILKGKFFRKILLYLEKIILSRFDRVSTISQSMYDFAASKNINQNKLILFPNWVDTKFIENQNSENKKDNPYLKELNIKEDSIIVMYSGTMGEKQGLDILPSIIKHFEGFSNIYWLLAGEGPMKKYLKEKQRIYKYKNNAFNLKHDLMIGLIWLIFIYYHKEKVLMV